MNFEKLQKEIADLQLGNAKLTDIKTGTYALVLPAKDGETIFLVGAKKNKYPISLRGLAAMRVVTAADKITVKTTKEARDNDNFRSLQSAIVDDSLPITENTKFSVVGHLRIHDAGSDELVYKNEHYTGYPEYVKTTRKIAAKYPSTGTFSEVEKADRNAQYTEATEVLRASKVKKDTVIDDKNLIMMPVFTVTN
jgi:hypothetical protein